jgi:cyclomaltodextrinase
MATVATWLPWCRPISGWQARAELKKAKPDIMLLAEASKPELLVQAFDIDYDWPLLATLNKVLINSAPASDLQASWEESRRRFPRGALHMRVSDDHDEARAVARYGIRGALAASVLMFTLDGVPCFTTAWKSATRPNPATRRCSTS